MTLPKVRTWWRKVKKQLADGADYARLLGVAAKAQDKVRRLEESLEEASASAAVHYRKGILSGRSRVVGEILASECGAALSPLAMARVDGKLLIAALVDPAGQTPAIGSLWLLRVRGLQALQAVLRVTGQSEEAVQLSVEEKVNNEFMDELTVQASTVSEVPPALEIVQRSFETIDELREEYSG
jgi:hypothetical protein